MPEMAEVTETVLPGVGVRFDFLTERGQRIGVLCHRTGRREIVVYQQNDPDASGQVIRLEEEDSHTLAELLGGSRIAEELAKLQQAVEGLAIDWLPVPAHTPFVGRSIGDTQARSRTGVSIVAVLRDDSTIPAPGPDVRLEADDTLLVVGTPRGIESLAVLLRTG